jgi:methyl-accepting chemotaxis protein
MPDNRSFERRTVLVKHGIQFKYIALIFLSVLCAALLVGFEVYHAFANVLLNASPELLVQTDAFQTVLVVKIALYLTLILFIALMVSHRIAGPIYRFEKSAQIISTGDLTHRVSLRTGDELTELQEEFNGMLAGLQSLLRRDRTLAADCARRAAQLLDQIPQGEDQRRLRDEIAALRDDIGRLTQSFKI